MHCLQTNVFLLLSLFAACCGALPYSVLYQTGISCPARDSCLGMGGAPFDERNCECDDHCAAYDDCCVDAGAPPRWSSPGYQCMPYGQGGAAAHVVGCCPRAYAGPAEVRLSCRDPDIADPWAAAPATDLATNVTYRNRYCAECNAAGAQLHTWAVGFDCGGCDLALTSRDLRFRRGRWGVDSASGFVALEMGFDKPVSLPVRRCRSGLVSACPVDFQNQTMRRLCGAYTAVCSVGGILFRNPHCLLCNRPDAADASCHPGEGVVSRKNAFSFALLLDVNRSDGDRVGMVQRCPAEHKYDPFFKKCRPLVCAIPGYVKEEGKCVKKKANA